MLDQLEKLAKAATPGPWELKKEANFNCVYTVLAPNSPREWVSYASARPDSAFIAAANPDTVLKLIAVARSAAILLEHTLIQRLGKIDGSLWSIVRRLDTELSYWAAD